jgi:hypothetical protein
MQKEWVASFERWLKDNQARLEQENIRVEILGTTAYTPRSIHVNFFTDCQEATVQLWEDGQSDFHLLDWEAAERDPEVGVVVTHHDFNTTDELSMALEDIVRRLSATPTRRKTFDQSSRSSSLKAAMK